MKLVIALMASLPFASAMALEPAELNFFENEFAQLDSL